MKRFGIFVDGSNLSGSIGKLNIKVRDYEAFYQHIFKEAASVWSKNVIGGGAQPDCQLQRTYWYQVGSMDNLVFGDMKLQSQQREYFGNNPEVLAYFTQQAQAQFPDKAEGELFADAWRLFWDARSGWYEAQLRRLNSILGFNYKVQESCDFMQIIECGHWKVDIQKAVMMEKGIDTALAVDVATIADSLDVVILVSGDADAIPCVESAKRKGANVGVVDFLSGDQQGRRGKQASSRLHMVCDFVIRISDSALIRDGIAIPREKREMDLTHD